MTENQAQQFLQFLKSLPETRAITFRGYVDATITEGRPIVTPTLGATSHSVAIATNNLEKPEVAIFVGTSGRDLTPILEGAPNYNLQEVTYLPGTYFYQHPVQELLGVTIQLHEEVRRNPETEQFEIAIKRDSWQPIILELEPQLRATYANPLDLPEGASERFLIPLD